MPEHACFGAIRKLRIMRLLGCSWHCRYLPGYPYTAPNLRILNEKGISSKNAKALSKQLHHLATDHSKLGEVMIREPFDIILWSCKKLAT